MNDNQLAIVKQCSSLSAAGSISFGEVVGRLMSAGIERYHADYSRMETTYYLPGGESTVLPIALERGSIAEDFSAATIGESVRQAQSGEIAYPQFLRQTAQAGCIGYFVQITGKRVQYFGRNGEMHTEWFPGAHPGAGRH